MNKTDLVAAVAEKAGITKTAAGEAVESLFDVIMSTLQRGDDVRIIGFGNFQVANRPAAVRRNPATGKPMNIPATRVPKFKAGKTLKEAVKGNVKKAA